MKKYFVFSDIHGHLEPLVDALDKAGFNLQNENHILLSLGDHFDRGTDNLKVLGFIKYFSRIKRLIAIRGNHDDFLLNFLKGVDNGMFNVRYNGMGNTLIELSDQNANTMDKIRDSINKNHPYLIELLEEMVEKFELGSYIFTHAGYELSSEKGWYLYNFAKTPYFIRNFDPKDKTYVFGHFHARELNYYEKGIDSDQPFETKGFIGIDARTVVTKSVNVLVFDMHGNREQ